MIAVVIVIGLILMVLTSLRRRRREARRRPRGVITSTYLPEDSSAETFEAQHLPMPFEPVGGRSAHLNSGGHYAAIPSMSSHAGSLVHLNPGHVGYAHSWRGSPEPHNSGVVDYRDTWRSTSVPPAAAMEYTPSFSGSGIRPTASEPTNESWGALPSPHDSPYLAPRQLPPIFGSALRVAPNQHGFLPQGSETGQTH
ncbi:hypothetical protein CPB83DRAFT_864125 [Crepidotus variabilis]|uniref:Uncharacterized protein n=1 Tax=Crepidotus variabilis TaxID=179855 RepID=A0A9P6E4Z4_9AGAR|nr:hypothetical protein CPB83DRAFT_864125 [Crepidotus variabilis]